MSAALARCFPPQRICVGTVGAVRDVSQRRWRGSGGGGHDAPRPEALSSQHPPCLCLVFLRVFNSCRCRVCCCYELPCLFDSFLCRVCCCYRCASNGVSMLLHMLGLASAGGADLFLRWVTEMCTGSVLPRAGQVVDDTFETCLRREASGLLVTGFRGFSWPRISKIPPTPQGVVARKQPGSG